MNWLSNPLKKLVDEIWKEGEKKENKSEISEEDLILDKWSTTHQFREYIEGLCEFKDTFLKFPIQDPKEILILSEFQLNHVNYVLKNIAKFKELRHTLVPSRLRDDLFWRIYFSILSHKIERIKERTRELEIKEKEVEKWEKHYDEIFSKSQLFEEEDQKNKIKKNDTINNNLNLNFTHQTESNQNIENTDINIPPPNIHNSNQIDNPTIENRNTHTIDSSSIKSEYNDDYFSDSFYGESDFQNYINQSEHFNDSFDNQENNSTSEIDQQDSKKLMEFLEDI